MMKPCYIKGVHCRGSRLQMLCKIGFLEKFAKLKGKHLCRSQFLIKSEA